MSLLRLPGLVDIHVHLRDPGQTHKEDFFTGTSAALAGGYTHVFDMPNNAEPIVSLERLERKIASAQKQAVSSIGFHFGSLGENFDEFEKVKDRVFGLKLYLNMTTGGFIINPDAMEKICEHWPKDKPILLHTEADIIERALAITAKSGHHAHVCHISSEAELSVVMKAKAAGISVSCGVTPHHLFLNENDKKEMGNYATMMPSLKPQSDQDFLWDNLDEIDVVESDHAPHTKEEKDQVQEVFGVPGLETSLPLLLQAEREGKLTRRQIISKCASRPREILNLSDEVDTYIEVEEVEYEVKNEDLNTKAGWSPFKGRKVFGKVQNVYIKGQQVLKDGEVVARPGSGDILVPTN